MEQINLEPLMKIIQLNLSNNIDERSQAVQILEQNTFNPLFGPQLLLISASNNVDLQIRQLAVITLKNFVKNYWKTEDKLNSNQGNSHLVTISLQDKEIIKIKVLEALANIESNQKILKKNLLFIINEIINVESEWSDYINFIISNINSSNSKSVLISLEAFYQLSKKFEWELHGKRESYDNIFDQLYPHLNQFIEQISNNEINNIVNSDSIYLEILTAIVKIFNKTTKVKEYLIYR